MSRYSKEIEEIRIMDQQHQIQQTLSQQHGSGKQMMLQQHPLLFQHQFNASNNNNTNPSSNNHSGSSNHSSPLTATTQVSQQQQQQQQQQLSANQSQQLLHFHHSAATLHPHQLQQLMQQPHHYSTLHHSQVSPQQQASNHHHQSSSQNSQSSSSQTMPFLQHLQHHQHHLHHLHPQPNQNQSHNQNQYSLANANANNSSDYSSSTYHVYDQILGDQIIDDLIVIKQERMKKKLEQEHRRKVILFSCALILLVGLLLFLLVQLFRAAGGNAASSNSPPSLVANSNGQLGRTIQSSMAVDPQQLHFQQWRQIQEQIQQQELQKRFNNQQQQFPNRPAGHAEMSPQPQLPFVQVRPNWAPPVGAQSNQPLMDFSQVNQQQQQQQLQQQQKPTLIIGDHFNAAKFNQEQLQEQLHQKALGAGHQDQPTIAGSNSSALAPTRSTQQQQPQESATRKVVTFKQLPQDQVFCSGRGSTVMLAEGEFRCRCDPGYSGDQCQEFVRCSPCNSNNALNCDRQADCIQPAERQCDDGLDNDGDGLIDCADSECCGDQVCHNSTFCMKSPDPLEILLRKQPLPPTSSFFQRMQFLIEKLSSQIYSNPKDFNDSLLASKYLDRTSVIRGRVTYMRQGVIGVRVSVVGQLNLGVTFTRDNGHFDLMVNGGGAVVVEFRRAPFATLLKTVRVPWNEIVLMDQIELMLDSKQQQPQDGTTNNTSTQDPDSDSSEQQQQQPVCSAHNYHLMRAQVLDSSNKRRQQQQQQDGNNNSKSPQHQPATTASRFLRAVILRDSSVVQQTINLPGSVGNANEQPVSLVYMSSKANEFMSTISVQLISPQLSRLPPELKLVHLKIVIEGNLFVQLFEPQLNLRFNWTWNRRNVYKQKSFGFSTALVSVGYEYADCQQVIWTFKHIQLAGHDLSNSDIGNHWNLNIHHRFNHRDAILQLGDGRNFNLRQERPLVVQAQMGDGYPRAPMCPYCDGQVAQPVDHRLLWPLALVSGPDNSLYVGDFNLVRRMEPASQGSHSNGGRTVRTILELPVSVSGSRSGHLQQQQQLRYSLALSPAESKLYLADQDRFRVFYVREKEALAGSINDTSAATGENSLVDNNLIPVVGSGIRCQLDENNAPTERDNCGDAGPARMARLVEPRSIAFDLSNRMYIADGPNVRLVDANEQKIYTLLGDYSGLNKDSRFPCTPGETVPMHKFAPKRPVSLALSPIDDTLHILDENIVYKITQDKRVQLVAGKLDHCGSLSTAGTTSGGGGGASARATDFAFHAAHSIAFNPSGQLLVADDGAQMHGSPRVYMIEPEEDSISIYAGANPSAGQPDEQQQSKAKLRSTNVLPAGGQQAPRAREYKFGSIGAIAVDQRGNLLVADKQQLRIVSIEPDLPQMNAASEYELQAPDNADEQLVFNRFGHHVATRDLSGQLVAGAPSGHSASASPRNKHTFAYNVNTSFGQLSSISFANGNKLSIYRDGPHHSVKMIETALGAQCKLDISRYGQVHSIILSGGGSNQQQANAATKITLTYPTSESGLLKQIRDQSSGETYDFLYDESGHAHSIGLTSARLMAPVECSVDNQLHSSRTLQASQLGRECSALIVAQ